MAKIFINGVLREMTTEEDQHIASMQNPTHDTDLEQRVAELELQLKFARILLGAEE